MIINGVDRRFFMGVGAAMKIAAHCPGGDIAKMGDMFGHGVTRDLMDIMVISAIAMNEDYLAVKGLKAEPLKRNELLLLPPAVLFGELQEEIIEAYKVGLAVSVDAEPKKDPKNGESGATGDR